MIWNATGTAKNYIAKYLVEGSHLGYIDHGYFNQGKKFAFQQMMRHNATVNALIYLSFTDTSFVNEKKTEINSLVLDHLNRQKKWRYRWQMCEKICDIEYTLKEQLNLYGRIKKELPQDNISWEYCHELKSKKLLLAETLYFLKSSFYEHMLKIKSKSEWDAYLQEKFNHDIRQINQKFDCIKEAPPIEDVCSKANELSKNAYENLFPLIIKKGEFGSILNSYVDAINKDLLTEAKWISLSSETTTETTPFNWNQEAGHFENYKRKIQRILKTKNHLDEIIDEFTNETIQICSSSSEDLLKYQYLYGVNNEIIYSCWKQRDELDNLRIKLRQGYLKDIKTRVNESNKGYWERLVQSAQNKGLRLLLDGEILEKTEPYNDVNSKISTAYTSYRDLLNTIKMKSSNHTVSLSPIADTQDDYPVFYDKDDYVSFVQSNEMNTTTLNVIKYNLERICHFQDQSYFKKNLDELKKVVEVYTQIISLKKWAKNLESYTQHKLNLNDEFFNKVNIIFLGSCFKKFVISEKNRHSPIDALRITTSVTNKFSRIATKGNLFDDTKEFPDIYIALHTQIKKAVHIINQGMESFLKTHPILRLKTTIVFFNDGDTKIKLTHFPEKQQSTREEKNREKVTIKINSIIEDYYPDKK